MTIFFFFNDTATTEIYTLSLHDALPILRSSPLMRRSPHRGFSRPKRRIRLRSSSEIGGRPRRGRKPNADQCFRTSSWCQDRKSTRLNSSHSQISYAVFCLKKKKTTSRVI